MNKQDLLALEQSNHAAMVAAINSLPDVSVDPLQADLDAANAKVADLQGKLDAANAVIAKALADAKLVEADLAPQA